MLPGNAVEGKSELLSACVEQDVGVMAMKILGGGKLLSPWDPGSFSRWQLGGDGRDPSTRRPLRWRRRNLAHGSNAAPWRSVQAAAGGRRGNRQAVHH